LSNDITAVGRDDCAALALNRSDGCGIRGDHVAATISTVEQRMQLGTSQEIFLFEHRRQPHRRKVSVTIMGE